MGWKEIENPGVINSSQPSAPSRQTRFESQI